MLQFLENVLYGKIAHYGLKESILGFPKPDQQEAYQILSDLGIGKLAYKWTSQTSGWRTAKNRYCPDPLPEPTNHSRR